ncbi:MAG: flagellar basal body-associated FliL family protein [Pseudomonadales bacterium]
MAEAQTEQAAKPGGARTLILFAVAVVIAVAGSVAGTLYFVNDAQSDAAQPEQVETKPQTAIYHNLRPAFIVNYLTGSKSRLLQADLVVMARDPAVIEALITHTPLIRSRILAYLSDLDFYELQTASGKESMREGLRDLINGVLREQAQIDGVQSVLLNNFVMQ